MQDTREVCGGPHRKRQSLASRREQAPSGFLLVLGEPRGVCETGGQPPLTSFCQPSGTLPGEGLDGRLAVLVVRPAPEAAFEDLYVPGSGIPELDGSLVGALSRAAVEHYGRREVQL